MKKLMVCGMAVLLVLTMTVSVFAAGNFVSSPSATDFPFLVDYAFTGDCDGELIVTPYSQRDTLDKDAKDLIEQCYEEIKDSKDLTKLFDMVKVPEGKSGLAVGDLFNIHFEGCKAHNEHNPFTATIKPSTLENFVAVVALVNGEWVVVDSKVDGDNLVITSSYYGPYAILLSTETSPETGDSFPWIYVVLMGISVVGLTTVLVALKKKA